MALVLGTNCGFVTSAPLADPLGGTTFTADFFSHFLRTTSPAGTYKVTEIGWWCNTATEDSNFEVGLYAADGAVVPGEAGTRLLVNATNAKGTGAGWKTVSGLNLPISASTNYWLAFQLDDTTTATFVDGETGGGLGRDAISGATALADPAGGGALVDSDAIVGIYALVQEIDNVKVSVVPPIATSIDTDFTTKRTNVGDISGSYFMVDVQNGSSVVNIAIDEDI